MYKLGGPSVVGELATISMLVGKAGLTLVSCQELLHVEITALLVDETGPRAMDCGVTGIPGFQVQSHFGLGPGEWLPVRSGVLGLVLAH